MAKVTDVTAEHREHARKVPPEILDALCPAELRCRAQRAAELTDMAHKLSVTDGAIFLRQCRKVLEAEPVWDFVQRHRELLEFANQASGRVASELMGIRSKHAENAVYPPGLVEAVQSVYDKSPAPPELSGVANAIVRHHDPA